MTKKQLKPSPSEDGGLCPVEETIKLFVMC